MTTLYVTFKEYGRKRSFESGTNWSDLLKQARDYAKNLEQRPMEVMSHDPNVLPLNYTPNSWREKKGKTEKNGEEKKQKKQFKFAVSL